MFIVLLAPAYLNQHIKRVWPMNSLNEVEKSSSRSLFQLYTKAFTWMLVTGWIY